ncbi:MAG: transporter substrate-binding protein [Frankiales bacterium]|jgi:branched-chain amino acid transport system substrate-binding protein|nr:transporter substrate-binding protein [Frankiales bacterium]
MSNNPFNPELFSRLSRRQVLKAAGVGGAALAALPLLSACGDEGSTGTTTPGAAGGGTVTTGGDVSKIMNFIGPVEEASAGKGLAFDMGLVLAFTGPGAFFGRTMSAGAKLAAAHIESLGGPKFNLISKDHKSGDPQAGVQAVKELGFAKVPAKLASYNDDLGAMLPGTEQYKMFTFDGGGGTSTYAQGKPYFYGTRAITPNDGWPGTLRFIKEELPEVKRISTVFWDLGPNNQINADDLKRRIQEAGLEMGTVEYVKIGATDYSAAMQKIKADKPDAVFLGIFGNDIGVFMKQFSTSGINKPVVCAEYTQASADVAGAAYEGLYLGFDYFNAEKPDNGWSQIFVDEFKKANAGGLPDYYAANYYEDLFGMWDVIRRVLAAGGDPKDGAQLDKAWREKPEFPSVYGGDATTAGVKAVDVAKTHSVTKRPMTLSQYKNGKVVPLAYFDLEAADYRKA